MIEVYQVFETQQPLTRDQREFYVELYGEDLDRLRKDLLFNSIPNKSFLVTGQSGNGKSTALNFLPDDRIQKKYDVKYLKGREVFKLDDIDVIDVILMIGLTVVKDHDDLRNRFLSELEELKNLKLGRIQKEQERKDLTKDEAGAGVSFGAKLSLLNFINLGSRIFAQYKIEKEKRESIREVFTLDKLELIEKVNGIIDAYVEEALEGKKQLLLIIDDLEKMRDQGQTKELFVDNIYALEEIHSTKIITFPVHLATRHALYRNASKFGVRIDKNPFEKGTDEVAARNRDKLRQVIRRRMENQDLVREDAVEEAVHYCGGNLRFLMEIMQKAARNAVSLDVDISTDSLPILPRDVETAIEEMASLASLSIMKRTKMLREVMMHHQEPPGEEWETEFTASILDNTIFAYFNGHPWYDLNPVIRKGVEVYSRSIEKDPSTTSSGSDK